MSRSPEVLRGDRRACFASIRWMLEAIAPVVVVAALVLLRSATPAGAQVIANPSAAITAMGGTGTGSARGIDAPAWNPAGLGLPSSGKFSFSAIVNAGGAGGSGPIGLKDFKPYANDSVPDAVRRAWLDRIRANGGQSMSAGADFSILAIAIGPVALSYSATARASGNIPPDAAEVLLFGNYGYLGAVRNYQLRGARVDGSLLSTAAVSWGIPLNVRIGRFDEQHFAIGVTGKYLMGHALAIAADAGSDIFASPVDVNVKLRTVSSDTGGKGKNDGFPMKGSGMGVDLGVAWEGGPLRVGIAVRDVVNTFAWQSGDLFTQLTTLRYSGTTKTQTTSPWAKASTLSAAGRDSVEQLVNPLKVDPSVAVGVSWDVGGRLTLAGEFQQRTGSGIATSPTSRIGVGAQWKVIPFLPLRAGYSQTSDANFVTGGVGLDFAWVRLDLAGGVNTKTSGDGVAAFSLTFGRH